MPNLTAEQQNVVRSVVTEVKKRNIQVITFAGYAGVGKSTCLGVISEALANFAVCAFTGRAANVLRNKGMSEACTIHSLIYKPFQGPKGVEFILKSPYEMTCEGFLVDESSMISKDLYEDLLSFGLPVVFVGDHGQLEPVGQDIRLMASPMYRLETIHRNAGEIAHFAGHLRKGNLARTFPADSKVEIVTPQETSDAIMLGVDQMICAYNRFRVAKNDYMRNLRGYTKLLERGEKIMCLRNNRALGLFNGMQGEVLRLRKKNTMDFVSNGVTFEGINFDPNQFGKERNQFEFGADTPHPFDYADTITCHKCVHPDTLVESSDGLVPIKNLPPAGLVATITGTKSYSNLVKNHVLPAIEFTTEGGYKIIVTPDHKVEVWDGVQYSLREARHVSLGSFFRLRLGVTTEPNKSFLLPPKPNELDCRTEDYEVPRVMSDDFAEFLGLMVADGTVWRHGFRLLKRHEDVVNRFGDLCRSLFGVEPKKVRVGDTNGYEVNSVLLSKWLENIGSLFPENKDIPLCILRSASSIQNVFLRGLFEGGTVNMKGDKADHIEFFSAYPDLLKKVKVMLLRAGIVTGFTKNRAGALYIYGNYCGIFRDKIGFVSDFKQKRLKESSNSQKNCRVPISKAEIDESKRFMSLRRLNHARQRGYVSRSVTEKLPAIAHKMQYHHVRVIETQLTLCESMCVEVSDGHVFLQNGFPFGNSQGGEWPLVLVFEQECSRWDHKRWTYTAASRGQEKVWWVVEKRHVPSWLT